MKLIVFFALIGLCFAAPTTDEGEATIVEGSETVAEYFNPTGYDYKFRTSNSIEKQENADLGSNTVTGEYSYISPEGQTIKVTYTAGAGIGFYPKSEIIPAAIIESIELNLKNPPEDSKKK